MLQSKRVRIFIINYNLFVILKILPYLIPLLRKPKKAKPTKPVPSRSTEGARGVVA
jgi:hypothetical protein